LIIGRLRDLKALLTEGVLTDAEFGQQKKLLLAALRLVPALPRPPPPPPPPCEADADVVSRLARLEDALANLQADITAIKFRTFASSTTPR
jgi:hypothetical protein